LKLGSIGDFVALARANPGTLNAAAASGITLLRNAVGFASQRRDTHARHRLAIETKPAVAGRD